MRFALNILALVGGMTGAVVLASNAGLNFWGYVLFMISALSSVGLLWNDKQQRGLLALNGFFVCVNAYGLLNYAG